MGRVIVEQIISADGFAAGPDGSLEFFQLPGEFDSTDPGQLAMLERVDAILLGANTYRMFSAYWPTADESTDAGAGPIHALPKHVVSSTLESAPCCPAGGLGPASTPPWGGGGRPAGGAAPDRWAMA